MAEFLNGLKFEKPKAGVPEWILSKASIHVENLKKSLDEHKNENGYINLNLKQRKDGGYMLEVDTWKRDSTSAQPTQSPAVQEDSDNLPF